MNYLTKEHVSDNDELWFIVDDYSPEERAYDESKPEVTEELEEQPF